MKKVNDNIIQRKIKERRSDLIFISFIMVVLTLFSLFFYYTTFVWIKVKVSGNSMNLTLLDGDFLIVNKNRSPYYGDMIIIEGESTNWIIKRVIGMSGDTIKIVGTDVFRKHAGEDEFTLLKEDYAYKPTSGSILEQENIYTVGEGEIFYLGDNRFPNKSSDSRDARKGNCTVSQVVGVVEEWSYKNKTLLNIVSTLLDISSCEG